MARQLPTRIVILGDYGEGQAKTWERYRDKEAPLTKTRDDSGTAAMKQWATAMQARIRDPEQSSASLPVLGYYGTGRLWAQKKLTEFTRGKDDTEGADFYIRTFAYLNCLDPSSTYKHFKEWFTWATFVYVERVMDYMEGKSAEAPVHAADGPILAVRHAIDCFLQPTTGWHSLEYSHSHEKSLVLRHPQLGTLKVEMLSDGIRSVLAMIGDIAYRCIRLNPHLGGEAPRETEGVVLIDEIDMHLHPRWQQMVVGQLREAFPKIQFIVTTHSPQVLTTVKRENIRLLGRDAEGAWYASPPQQETKGVESGVALNDAMHVNPIPPVDEAGWLADYTAMIEAGTYEDAEGLALRQKLLALYGLRHPIILDAERLIRFQAFKLRKKSNPQD